MAGDTPYQRPNERGLAAPEEICVPYLKRLFLPGVLAFGIFGASFTQAEEVPIPTPRPSYGDDEKIVEIEQVQKQRRLRPSVIISRTPQVIPPSRQDVRTVGWKFLPDASEEIELAGEAAAHAAQQLKLENGRARATEITANFGSDMPRLAEIPEPKRLSSDEQ